MQVLSFRLPLIVFGLFVMMCRTYVNLLSLKCIFLVGSMVSATAYSDQVTVAVAANFINPMKQLKEAFEQQTSHKVKLVSGSSGRFFSQISHGAPFDLFLSADSDKPKRLVNSALASAANVFTYAFGRLVLWSADVNREINEASLSIDDYDHLAMANAKLAPYGVAAKEVLRKIGVEKKTRSKWVVGENISQTYQFVVSQNAEYGFIAASQWQSTGPGWLVPVSYHKPIQQDGVILTRAKDNKAALELVEYLQSPAAAVIIQAYGYQVHSY